MLGGISQLLQDASHRPGRVEAERLPQRDALLARAALDGARGRVQRGISAFERAPQFLTGRNAVLPAVLPIRARPPRLGLVLLIDRPASRLAFVGAVRFHWIH